jgi:catechol 2,3-dioxygenase-like lactoylglutathione lyase family enzyme
MSTLGGIHHLGLTVTDVERSASWYEDVLGFRQVGQLGSRDDERRKIFLRHEGLSIRLGLVEHHTSTRAAFDETVPGLDHLAFTVASRSELEQWLVHLSNHRIHHSLITDARSIPGALVLVFRDPDNIQLELFVEPPAAPPASALTSS